MKESKGSRTRAASAASSTKRSSHRSRRDHDKEKDTERSSHRSHRTHHERSRDDEKEHRSSRKRSKSPEITINGASRRTVPSTSAASTGHTKTYNDPSQSSRKRRSDDEDYEDRHHDRKRHRRDHEDVFEGKENGHRSSRPSKHETKDPRFNHDRTSKGPSQDMEKEKQKPTDAETEKPKSPPKGPKIDQHAREREARNAERVAREEQRKARAMAGQIGGARVNGKSTTGPGRRVSYKYEDEETTLMKGESEREALRYR